MAAGYVVVTMNISDAEQYRKYMALAPASIRAHGGEYAARGGKQETLEGDWNPHRVALLKFPSYAQAKAWYDSEQYRQARAQRKGATDYFNLVLVEGVDAQPWD